MTYLESFRRCATEKELMDAMRRETEIAIFIGGNPDRIKAIEDTANQVSKEKGW